MTNTRNVLEADSIVVSYNERLLLTDIYIRCEQDEIVGLLGRNGAGKSTLLNVIFGKTNADHKSVRINGQWIGDGFTAGNISMLPQKHMIPAGLKISEAMKLFKVGEEAIRDVAPGMTQLMDQRADQLSGGERRFIELLLVLFSKSKFCLLDEPFSGLSPIMVEKVIEILKDVKKSKGIIITDHRYREVVDCADRIYLMRNGSLMEVEGKEDMERFGYVNA